jgi:transcriptional regulator with XRE-family HTH domain
VMAWRRDKGLTQEALAGRAHLTRAYVSRLEGGGIDPSLSSLRRIAEALRMGVGRLLEEAPRPKRLSREALDQLARAALEPGAKDARSLPAARILAQLIQERRRALGLYAPRKRRLHRQRVGAGTHAARWLRASLGENQWQALLKRIDKLASLRAASL